MKPVALKEFRGGVLLDLFLIALLTGALLVGGVAAFLVWRRGGAPEGWRRALSLVSTAVSSRISRPRRISTEPDLDVSDKAAWIQARARDLLSQFGVADKRVVSTFTAERQEDGIRWLEDTLEVRRPRAFDDKKFLTALAPVLAERRLVVMADEREPERWTLCLGDRKRVYEHLIIDGGNGGT